MRDVTWERMSPKSPLVAIALMIAGLVGITLALRAVHPRMRAVAHVAGGPGAPTNLPWRFDAVGAGNRLDVTLPVHWATPDRWRIVPDDDFTALRVNGAPVPLADVPAAGLHDWEHGFVVDLGPRLHRGDSFLELTVTNGGGPGGIDLRPVVGWRSLLLAAGLAPWLLGLARLFRIGRWETVVLVGALGVTCWYWGMTASYERAYDVKHFGEGGHLDYVVYVGEKGELPPPDQGWQYYQPPLYYLGGALAWRWAKVIDASGPETLQAYSLALWLVFLTASVASLRLALRGSRAGLLVGALAVALWPSGVLAGPRIGNDLALYAASAMATYFMLRWWRGQRPAQLAGMALSVAIAFLFKSSAMALLAAALVVIALRLVHGGHWRRPRGWARASAATGVMFAGVALGLARGVWYWHKGKLAGWLVANADSLDAGLRVPNDVASYIPLDLPTYLSQPWMSSWSDDTARANFWNYFLRSSLSGEFHFAGTVHRAIAIFWGAALIALVLLSLLRIHRRPPTAADLWRDAPLWLLGFFWLASAVSARALHAFSCQADFRYVLPVLIPFVAGCARGGLASKTLLSLVALTSVAFFATL